MQEDFPRGGVKRKRVQPFNRTDRLFCETIEIYNERKRDVVRRIGRGEVVDIEEGKPFLTKGQFLSDIQPLARKDVVNGMVIVGFFRKVVNLHIAIELPNNLNGTVSVADISDSYMELLQTYATKGGNVEKDDGPSDLKDLFYPGTPILCKIKSSDTEVFTDKFHGDKRLKPVVLTLNPKEVNSELFKTNPYPGMVLTGAVESVEDHGYIINVGLKSTKGFITKDKAKTYTDSVHPGKNLSVGEIIMCSVSSKAKSSEWGKSKMIQVSIRPKSMTLLKKLATRFTLKSVHPGSLVVAKIDSIFDDGLFVLAHGMEGFVHFNNLLERFRVRKEDYSVGEEVVCRVLYRHPVSDIYFVGISQSIYSICNSDKLFDDFKANEVIDKAKVLGISRGDVVCRLKNGILGIAKRSFRPNMKVKIGTNISCFVIGFNYFDECVVLSFECPKFTINDVYVGSYVTGRIVDNKGSSLRLVFGFNMTGFLPLNHVADDFESDVSEDFAVGKNVKCRVLCVKADKYLVFLTARPSLMNPELPLLTSYSDAVPGTVAVGWIIYSGKDVIVKFFNDVSGRITQNLNRRVLKYGHLVECVVLGYSPEENMLQLKFNKSIEFCCGTVVNETDEKNGNPVETEIANTPNSIVEENLSISNQVDLVVTKIKKELPSIRNGSNSHVIKLEVGNDSEGVVKDRLEKSASREKVVKSAKISPTKSASMGNIDYSTEKSAKNSKKRKHLKKMAKAKKKSR